MELEVEGGVGKCCGSSVSKDLEPNVDRLDPYKEGFNDGNEGEAGFRALFRRFTALFSGPSRIRR